MKTGRISEIDLLRFFGALSIVVYHYCFRGYAAFASGLADADNITRLSYLPLAAVAKYGYLGVDLFFLISGFVILMSADGRTFRAFFVSRATRLYPAFWACCTITYIFIVAIGDDLYTRSFTDYVLNMTLLGGFIPGVRAMDGVYWSLFVEIRFYALIAAILLIRQIRRVELFMLAWLAATVALVALGAESGALGLAGDLLIIKYSAFIIAGAVFFLISSKGFSPVRAGMVLVSWGLALYQSLKNLDGFRANYNATINEYVVAAIVTGLFLIMLLVSIRRTGWIARRDWQKAGALTYPLYLLHANIGFVVFNRLYDKVNPHLLVWATVLVMIASAYLIHLMVEKRFAPLLKTVLEYPFVAVERVRARYGKSPG